MKTEIETAIKFLAGKVTGDIKACDAQQYAQAALSFSHALAALKDIDAQK